MCRSRRARSGVGRARAAAVVLNEGNVLDLSSVRAWAKELLATHKLPSRLLVLDSLPRNAVGKVMKPAVAALFQAAGRDPPPNPPVDTSCYPPAHKEGGLGGRASSESPNPYQALTPANHWILGRVAGWTLDGMDSVIYALVLSPALTELLPKSGTKPLLPMWVCGIVLFALFLVGWGLSLVWGPIADRFGRSRVLAATIFVYAVFTGAAALSQTRVATGIVPVAGRHRNRRRVGPGRNIRRRSLARRPSQNGRRIFADRLLRGLFSGFGSQLHGRSAPWLACHVLVRSDTRRRGYSGSAPSEGVRTLATKGRGQSGSWRFFFAPDLQSSLHTANAGQYGPARVSDLRTVGGRSLCTDGNHQLGETRGPVAAASRAYVFLRHGLAVTGNHPRMPGGPSAGGTDRPQANSDHLLPRMAICILLSFGRAFYLPADFIRSSRCCFS